MKMIASAKLKTGKAIHRAIDMGGFLYIACNQDPTTMFTEKVQGEVNCKKCLALTKPVIPNYEFAYKIQALKHPFINSEYLRQRGAHSSGWSAGYHDGKYNLKKYLLDGLSDDFIKGYDEGFIDGQELYTYHYTKGNEKDKPLTSVPLKTFENSNQTSRNLINQINPAPIEKESKIKIIKFIFWAIIILFIINLLSKF